MKDFIKWITLYFYLKKQDEPEIQIWDYSKTFVSNVRRSVGYRESGNPTLWKLWGILLTDIEEYHRYCNEHATMQEYGQLKLDIKSPTLQLQIPRNEE